MDNVINDDCITIRTCYSSGSWDKLTSVFIKREGRDPTEAEVRKEEDRMRAALAEGIELMRKRLLEETGLDPDFGHVRRAFFEQMKDPEYNSDYTLYRRWYKDPAWPTTRRYPPPSSKIDPVDLTRSSPVTTNTPTKKHKTDLRQTNTEAPRSSPPLSTHLGFLSIVGQSKQGSVLQATSTRPIELTSDVHPQTNFATQMSEASRRKIKAVTKKPATSTASSKDVGRRPTTEDAAKTATETTTITSSQLLRRKHTADTRRVVHSKSSPPPASTGRISGTLSTRKSLEDASSTDIPRSLARPFVGKQLNTSLSTDKSEQLENILGATQTLPLSPSIISDKPFVKASQAQPDIALSQQAAPTSTRKQALRGGTVSASQYSEHFDDYIKEKLGQGIDARTHRIFKLAMLHASRWTLQNISVEDNSVRNLSSQVTSNERNSRIVNKCVEAVLDVCVVKDDSKPTDLYKLLDRQEKERQESLESVADTLTKNKKAKVNLMSELDRLEGGVQKEKDARDKGDEDRLRKHMEQKKERMQAKHGKDRDNANGDDGGQDEQSRKRKRDAEEEEHIDIDMLM